MRLVLFKPVWLPIPPLFIGGVFPYLVTYLDALLPAVSFGSWRWAGVIIFIIGFILAFKSARLIYIAEQWNEQPSPLRVPKRLVIVGPYKYVRNPMALGMSQIILGEGLYFQSIAILGYLFVLFVLGNLFLLTEEEKRLEEKFGEEYSRYEAGVGRWIPRLTPYKG